MELRALHPTLGVEVSGVDPLGQVGDAHVDALRAAMAEHQLLLFRLDRRLDPERQVEIAGWFGPPAMNGGDKAWSVLHSDNAAGRERLVFHSDFTYTDCPIKAISLQAIAVPEGGTQTAFVSAAHAWETLPPHMQERLASLSARHVQDRSIMMADFPVFVADHPLRYDHPRLGRPVLLFTEYHVRRINELEPDESDALIAELKAHLYRPENVYTHDWQLHDLVIWDNLALQHARTERADPATGARALQRVAVNEVGLGELVERARRREREAA